MQREEEKGFYSTNHFLVVSSLTKDVAVVLVFPMNDRLVHSSNDWPSDAVSENQLVTAVFSVPEINSLRRDRKTRQGNSCDEGLQT